ncbi:hypothetical protein B0H67DRAFT_272547 [Lasiosphaeris hirsuta]|uniref:Uncharacterized protein n=1 Tax=Lasiosphaeris hirsuta TaxID=260670 RepID=A0AA40A8D8_9PEZI|nr:hypothetical protein B0H67DRAFT_272547 [Lasiosphaeris hirsuta]
MRLRMAAARRHNFVAYLGQARLQKAPLDPAGSTTEQGRLWAPRLARGGDLESGPQVPAPGCRLTPVFWDGHGRGDLATVDRVRRDEGQEKKPGPGMSVTPGWLQGGGRVRLRYRLTLASHRRPGLDWAGCLCFFFFFLGRFDGRCRGGRDWQRCVRAGKDGRLGSNTCMSLSLFPSGVVGGCYPLTQWLVGVYVRCVCVCVCMCVRAWDVRGDD